MQRRISIAFVICLIYQINLTFGQDQQLLTESPTHIYWQSDRGLTINDFQGEPSPAGIKYCEEKGACVVPCLGLFVEVDIPRNYRKNKLEKVYYAPAFEKSCSYVINDSSDIRDGQIMFDIMELSSRIARKLLRETHNSTAIQMDSMNYYTIKANPDTILITGIGTSLAPHIKDSAWTFYQKMSNSYLYDMYFSDESKGFEKWRILVDDMLEKLEIYATKPEECYRMIKKQPIVAKHKPAYK